MSRFQYVGLHWLLYRCRRSLVNAVDILTLQFQSVVNAGKIGEEDYNIVSSESRDSTQISDSVQTKKISVTRRSLPGRSCVTAMSDDHYLLFLGIILNSKEYSIVPHLGSDHCLSTWRRISFTILQKRYHHNRGDKKDIESDINIRTWKDDAKSQLEESTSLIEYYLFRL
ncbi:hypothetical protein AVEN_63179-1 [Araneus ventricosus]|uniref:Uncharacterized protein n=1 Tax=Araneus ventricosus TaxID=182803 RepID=A0A4Y2B2Z8_ARAVE|nr:hypothetical protein AVEN_63179-1 [Araneus ventricosus]